MKRTNGKLKRFSPDEIAAMTRPPAWETLEERRAAMRRATTAGPRVKVQVTREMYRPR